MTNQSAERQRRRRNAQLKVKHYCSCGRMLVGNVGWASHRKANPSHRPVSVTQFAANGPDLCHCGAVVDTSEFRNRDMCTFCDDVRCDAFPGECRR